MHRPGPLRDGLLEARRGSLGARLSAALARMVGARPGEGCTLAWAAACFFCLLCSYFLLRPLREALGLAGGTDRLPWIWTGTLAFSLAVQPLFGLLTTRWPRRRFLPAVYHAATACLLAFWLLLHFAPQGLGLAPAYAFYVWLSVFNLFAVSVFFGFMADLFGLEQAKRLFGCLSVGGTLGALAGASLARVLAQPLGSVHLLLLAAALLQAAVLCLRALLRLQERGAGALEAAVVAREFPAQRDAHRAAAPVSAEVAEPAGAGTAVAAGPATASVAASASASVVASARVSATAEAAVAAPGLDAAARIGAPPSVWRGVRRVLEMPYLQAICAFTGFHTLFNTILYFQQASIVERAIELRDARVEVFATIDLLTQALTLLVQLFLTGRLMRWLGVGFALGTQPAVAGLGCLLVGLALWQGPALAQSGWPSAWPPELWAIVVAMVLTRASNFATAKPARESLYTVVERPVKYESKSFIDTFVYRAGDLLGAWGFDLLRTLGAGLSAIAFGAVPLALVWLAVGRLLGRKQQDLACRQGLEETDDGTTRSA